MSEYGDAGDIMLPECVVTEGLGCQRLRDSDVVHCVAAGCKLTVGTARSVYHYRGGDLTGDHPVTSERYTEPARPENTHICSGCGNCMD